MERRQRLRLELRRHVAVLCGIAEAGRGDLHPYGISRAGERAVAKQELAGQPLPELTEDRRQVVDSLRPEVGPTRVVCERLQRLDPERARAEADGEHADMRLLGRLGRTVCVDDA